MEGENYIEMLPGEEISSKKIAFIALPVDAESKSEDIEITFQGKKQKITLLERQKFTKGQYYRFFCRESNGRWLLDFAQELKGFDLPLFLKLRKSEQAILGKVTE